MGLAALEIAIERQVDPAAVYGVADDGGELAAAPDAAAVEHVLQDERRAAGEEGAATGAAQRVVLHGCAPAHGEGPAFDTVALDANQLVAAGVHCDGRALKGRIGDVGRAAGQGEAHLGVAEFHVLDDAAGEISPGHVERGVDGAGGEAQPAPCLARSSGGEDDGLLRCAAGDQRAVDADELASAGLDHCAGLDGEHHTRVDDDGPVENIGLVARPGRIGRVDGVAEGLHCAAGSDGKGQVECVAAGASELEGEGQGGVVGRVGCQLDGERICAVAGALARGEVAEGGGAVADGDMWAGAGKRAHQTRPRPPQVAHRGRQGKALPGGRAASALPVQRVAGHLAGGLRVYAQRLAGGDAALAQLAGVVRVEGCNRLAGVDHMPSHQPRRPVRMQAFDKPGQAGDVGRG